MTTLRRLAGLLAILAVPHCGTEIDKGTPTEKLTRLRGEPVATHKWVSSSGDFSAAASWSTAVAPSAWAASDVALFDGTSQTSVTAGLNESAVTVADFLVAPEYGGTIGSAGSPLRINSSSTFVIRGYGAVHLDTETVGTTVIVDSSNLTDAMTLYEGNASVFVKSGQATVAAACTFAVGASIGTFGVNATLNVLGTGDGPLRVLCMNGRIDMARAGYGTATPSSLWLVGGGTLALSGTWTSSASNVPTLLVTTGRLVMTGAEATQTDATILWLGGTVDLSGSGETFGSLFTSVIGPTANIIGNPALEAASTVWALTDLRKSYP